MLTVAFFRNLNQGQRGSPSTPALVDALYDAGASKVTPVRGNGTVILDAADPERTVALARGTLVPWADSVFLRNADWLRRRLNEVDDTADSRTELTLFDGSLSMSVLPNRAAQCTIVSAGEGFAIVENDSPQRSNGTPTIERVLGSPATSRGISTIRRVVMLLNDPSR